jgi:hypothetical protein
VAVEAAIFLKEQKPTTEVSVRDLRDNAVMDLGWASGKAFVKLPNTFGGRR